MYFRNYQVSILYEYCQLLQRFSFCGRFTVLPQRVATGTGDLDETAGDLTVWPIKAKFHIEHFLRNENRGI